MKLCTLCMEPEEGKILRELAYSKNRSLQDIARQIDRYDSMEQKAREHREKRLADRRERLEQYKEELKRYEEYLSYQAMDSILQGEDIDELADRILSDEKRKELEDLIRSMNWESEGISQEDIEAALKEYEEKGYNEIEKGKIKKRRRGEILWAGAP